MAEKFGFHFVGGIVFHLSLIRVPNTRSGSVLR